MEIHSPDSWSPYYKINFNTIVESNYITYMKSDVNFQLSRFPGRQRENLEFELISFLFQTSAQLASSKWAIF